MKLTRFDHVDSLSLSLSHAHARDRSVPRKQKTHNRKKSEEVSYRADGKMSAAPTQQQRAFAQKLNK